MKILHVGIREVKLEFYTTFLLNLVSSLVRMQTSFALFLSGEFISLEFFFQLVEKIFLYLFWQGALCRIYMIWVFEVSFSIQKLRPIVKKKKRKKDMPYGPFQSPYICVAIQPVPKQKQNLFFTNKTKTNILYIKKSPFQKMQMTYALNYVLYDIGSWHMGTIIKSFVL